MAERVRGPPAEYRFLLPIGVLMTFRFRPELQPFEERLAPRASVGVVLDKPSGPAHTNIGVTLPETPGTPIKVITPAPTPTPPHGGM